jgi:hypothetical protein
MECEAWSFAHCPIGICVAVHFRTKLQPYSKLYSFRKVGYISCGMTKTENHTNSVFLMTHWHDLQCAVSVKCQTNIAYGLLVAVQRQTGIPDYLSTENGWWTDKLHNMLFRWMADRRLGWRAEKTWNFKILLKRLSVARTDAIKSLLLSSYVHEAWRKVLWH